MNVLLHTQWLPLSVKPKMTLAASVFEVSHNIKIVFDNKCSSDIVGAGKRVTGDNRMKNSISLKAKLMLGAFGERLKRYRKKLKLTQEIIGKKVGVSGEAVLCWEKAKNDVPLGTVFDLAELLQVPVAELVSGIPTLSLNEDETARKSANTEFGRTPNRTENHLSTQSTNLQTGTGHVWIFSQNGKIVRLETSVEMPIALWQKLERYVQVIKPEEGVK